MVDLVDRWRPLFERLLDAMPVLLERLERWPEGFGHLDAFSRNAASIGDRMVMIDWAYAGIAPVGTDAAGIVGMTGMHGDVTGDDLGRLYRVVVDEYTAGLHAAGLEIDPADVEATVALLLVLRWTGFMTQIHALGDRLVEVAESVGGRPFADTAAAWAALSELVATLAESVLDRAEAG
ncbi:MAG: hypothetical protein HKN41_11545 [Ilumatobacter sp.]|nr:hypothetical protein [Ilumatobacter sp.]